MRWPLIRRALRVFSSPALTPDSIPGSTWLLRPYSGLNVTAKIQALEIELPLAEIYAGIEFSPESDLFTAPA